jgi:gliding motility-associated protein GldL
MGNFTDSIGWKTFIIKFGGIAAAIVIIGALFKIQHWPGASIMITIGMSSEVVIFLLSALDTFHPDIDWTRVYPELKHDHLADEKTQLMLSSGEEPTANVEANSDAPKNNVETVEAAADLPMETASAEKNILSDEILSAETSPQTKLRTTTTSESAESPSVMPAVSLDLSKLNIDTAGIAEKMKNFGESIGNFDAFASTVTAAQELSEKLQGASSAVNKFAEDYEKSSVGLNESAGGLTMAYVEASSGIADVGRQAGEIVRVSGKQMSQVTDDATKVLAETYQVITENINNVGEEACEMVAISGKEMSTLVQESTKILTENYQVIANNINNIGKEVCGAVEMSGKQMSQVIASATDSFAETFTLIDKEIRENLSDFGKNNNDYNKSLTNLNKNMSALNTAYELQVQEVVKYQKKSSEVGKYMEDFVAGLEKSAAENLLLHKELANLNTHVAELNNIYGNMLSAVQMVAKRK